MRKSRFENGFPAPKPGMAAMIDVIFLLLVFFAVASSARPPDILSELTVNRPSHGGRGMPPMVRISVRREGYALNGVPATAAGIDRVLAKAAAYAPNQIILIVCENDSLHENLVEALDLCASHGLANTALTSG